jgi:hypothetical protein
MKSIRRHPDAHLLPSRRYFSIFKLVALLRLWRRREPGATHAAQPDVIVAIDAHQSTSETLITGSWFYLTAACYLTALVPALHPAIAVLFALPVAVMLHQPVFISLGVVLTPALRALLRRKLTDSADLNSAISMTLLALLSIQFLAARSWLRFVAWQFFLGLALNASAALVMRILRPRVEALEASYGGSVSAA